jgi:hypothetical protein
MQRAEEIIAETYKQVLEAREKGRTPDKVVMNRELWLRVVDYRRSLGVIAGPVPDYLSEDGLFGLEIWYGNGPGIRVE